MEDLNCRFYSSQNHFSHLHEMGNKNSGSLEVFYDHINLNVPKQENVVINNNEQTLFTILKELKSIDEYSEYLKLNGSVTCENNQNITYRQKNILK